LRRTAIRYEQAARGLLMDVGRESLAAVPSADPFFHTREMDLMDGPLSDFVAHDARLREIEVRQLHVPETVHDALGPERPCDRSREHVGVKDDLGMGGARREDGVVESLLDSRAIHSVSLALVAERAEKGVERPAREGHLTEE
jgi:hypothetical protein